MDHDPAGEAQAELDAEPGIVHRQFCYCRHGEMPTILSPMTLRCSHIVHTQCFLQALINDSILPSNLACPVCNHQSIDYNPTLEENSINIPTLWNTNEVFREDIYELLKKRKVYTKFLKPYISARRVCYINYKESIKISIAYIKHQKRLFKKAIRTIPEHASFIRAMNAYSKKLNQIRNTYNAWDLHVLNAVPGTPKIPRRLECYYFGRTTIRV